MDARGIVIPSTGEKCIHEAEPDDTEESSHSSTVISVVGKSPKQTRRTVRDIAQACVARGLSARSIRTMVTHLIPLQNRLTYTHGH